MSNTISRAIKYLESKESYIMPTEFERLAAKVRSDIDNNVFGSMIVFPKKKKIRQRVNGFDPVNALSKIKVVDSYREKRMTCREACSLAGVSHSTYRDWSERLGIFFVKRY